MRALKHLIKNEAQNSNSNRFDDIKRPDSSSCRSRGKGTYKVSYLCSPPNKNYKIYTRTGEEFSPSKDFVIYYPRTPVSPIGFQEAVDNLVRIDGYHPDLKKFFMRPKQLITLVDENDRRFDSVVVDILVPLENADAEKFWDFINAYLYTLLHLVKNSEVTLEDLHAKYLHTDLKPDNVMKDLSGNIVFIDLEFYTPLTQSYKTTRPFTGGLKISGVNLFEFMTPLIQFFMGTVLNTYLTMNRIPYLTGLVSGDNVYTTIQQFLLTRYPTLRDVLKMVDSILSVTRLLVDLVGSKIEEDRIRKSRNKTRVNIFNNFVVPGSNTCGIFGRLLFTHNTPLTTFLEMIDGSSMYVRCCDSSGDIIGKGAQFRHGLDSQYGDIVFVFPSSNWWEIEPGSTTYGSINTATENPVIGRIFSSDKTFGEYNDQSSREFINSMLEDEAMMFTFRTEGGNGEECMAWDPKVPSVTWCNSQLHLSTNVSLDKTVAILVPTIYYDFIIGKNTPLLNELKPKIRKYAENVTDVNGLYSFMTQELINKYTSISGYPPLNPSIATETPSITRRDSNPLGSSSRLSLSPPVFNSLEKIYMQMLLENDLVSDDLRVLTYNVYWKAMESAIPACAGDVCLDNIKKNISGELYDFVCLQEASNHGQLFSSVSDSIYKTHHHESNLDVVTITYNSLRFAIQGGPVTGEISPGRPYMICKFFMKGRSRNTFVVNIHNSHEPIHDGAYIENIIMNVIVNLGGYNKGRDVVIVAGDFNRENVNFSSDFSEKYTAGGTCCLKEDLSGVKETKIYDHIFVSGKASIVSSTIPSHNTPSSDHAPLVSRVRMI